MDKHRLEEIYRHDDSLHEGIPEKKKKNKMCWQLSQLQIAKLEAGTGNKRLMQDTPEKSFNGQPYDAANCNIKGQA